jgi:hypothetical protein
MRLIRWIFGIAGVYGVLVLAPLYFVEPRFDDGTHPEWYFGFVGAALAWQVAFLVIAADPPRYRPLMTACMLEKFLYAAAVFALVFIGRSAAPALLGAATDAMLGFLFIWAWRATAAGSAPA